MNRITLFQLLCFDAVATEGGFQAAASLLGRSHASVFAAVKKLEGRLGLALFDRSGYRVALSDAGRSFHARAQALLADVDGLEDHAARLAMGEEAQLNIVIGDLCPLPEVFGLLRRFFDAAPVTRLHLHFEAIGGPWERLLDGDADLIVHYVDQSNTSIEFVDLCQVQLIPVVAPGFLSFPVSTSITPEAMRGYVQCVVRDTARHSEQRDYFLVEGAQTWTVSDQLMKKEVILQGMGWGHMPAFLVADELRDGRLLSIAGKHFRGGDADLVAARRRKARHGPMATRLWSYLADEAPSFRALVERHNGSRVARSAHRRRKTTGVDKNR